MKMAISLGNICSKYCSGCGMTQGFQTLDHNAISNDLYGNCFEERNDGEKKKKPERSVPYLQCSGVWSKEGNRKCDTNAIHLLR